jgi:hypothetical protein
VFYQSLSDDLFWNGIAAGKCRDIHDELLSSGASYLGVFLVTESVPNCGGCAERQVDRLRSQMLLQVELIKATGF